MIVGVRHGHYAEECSRGEAEVMEHLTRYLAASGVDVRPVPADALGLEGCDLLHFFGMSPEIHQLCGEAKKAGVPYVVSPLYWNDEYPIHYDLSSNGSAESPRIREEKLTSAYYRKMMLLNRVRQQKFILEGALLVFTTGACEKMLLCRDFDLPHKKTATLPVGVELAMAGGKPELILEKTGLDEFIVSVGEIRRENNQHILIEEAADRGLPLVLIGQSAGDDYSGYCEASAHDGVVFIPSADPALLRSAYAAAKACVQPGMSELPGISCLSAALAGTPVAATERGTTWDYLGGAAFYFDPEDRSSLGAALDAALASTPDPGLPKKLLHNFSWAKTALTAAGIYGKIATARRARAASAASPRPAATSETRPDAPPPSPEPPVRH